VHVSIIDTGSGLSEAVLPRLFSKFVSTDSGGTGLGLFVSKNIIESHGGRMEAQNNPNGKNTIVFIGLSLQSHWVLLSHLLNHTL
jgi:signal transduction histidine kinase